METVCNCAVGHAVIGLVHQLATEGVDDEGPVFEELGADMGTAVDGGAVDVVEGEAAPLEPMEP